jgi:sulfoxide reductase heme-binding subunit YedZ
MKKLKLTPLRIAVHLIGILPLVRLLYKFFTNDLTINPIQYLEQQTGLAAVTILVLSLATTPLRILFNWRQPTKHRRALGLYAFFYALVHVIIFVAIDYGFNMNLLIEATFEKRYTLVGSIAFMLLLALAVTSFNWWMKKLGKKWKVLHKAVYIIAPLVIVHFAWALKGDIFTLQGDVLLPLIYGIIVLLLLIVRISPIRKFLTSRHARA